LINNKSPFVASSLSNTYLLIKDARSLEHKVYKIEVVGEKQEN